MRVRKPTQEEVKRFREIFGGHSDTKYYYLSRNGVVGLLKTKPKDPIIDLGEAKIKSPRYPPRRIFSFSKDYGLGWRLLYIYQALRFLRRRKKVRLGILKLKSSDALLLQRNGLSVIIAPIVRPPPLKTYYDDFLEEITPQIKCYLTYQKIFKEGEESEEI